MEPSKANLIANLISRHERQLADEWIAQQSELPALRGNPVGIAKMRSQCEQFLHALARTLATANIASTDPAEWSEVRQLLAEISKSQAREGYSPGETATYVLSLKLVIFNRLRDELAGEPEALAEAIWSATIFLDKLAIFTTEVHQRSREDIIVRQQQELLELSTPVVQLWDNVLALPLIGTLDSARTQVVMESLLQKIVETGSSIAIIDITGVPTVDTLVAQHLLKTVAAARLMGADCIISGVRPQIAQTIVHLGVDLSAVITKATLASAFLVALDRMNTTITKR